VLIADEAARHHHLQPQQHHQLDALVAVDTSVCSAHHLGLQTPRFAACRRGAQLSGIITQQHLSTDTTACHAHHLHKKQQNRKMMVKN
jgi:hypothetical protein